MATELQENSPSGKENVREAYTNLQQVESEVNQMLEDKVQDEDLIDQAREALDISQKVLRALAREMQFG